MQRLLLKYLSIVLFLAVFLMPRVVQLHALEHMSEGDDQLACELCDITIQTQQQDICSGDKPYTSPAVTHRVNTYVLLVSYNSPVACIVTPTVVYNKPPPSLV